MLGEQWRTAEVNACPMVHISAFHIRRWGFIAVGIRPAGGLRPPPLTFDHLRSFSRTLEPPHKPSSNPRTIGTGHLFDAKSSRNTHLHFLLISEAPERLKGPLFKKGAVLVRDGYKMGFFGVSFYCHKADKQGNSPIFKRNGFLGKRLYQIQTSISINLYLMQQNRV
ncbi:hypothetical protein AVEN_100406-1 [Araneus ventricosus]|uniref:Uncharacterized protein n=1 Tax=Araneus ventricosus TaxID=182803 RepID=A0A4Y2JWH8_ARAVE|nr:hypothetical protein AVEN_100406-1 [Araneus ventricosus]